MPLPPNCSIGRMSDFTELPTIMIPETIMANEQYVVHFQEYAIDNTLRIN